ncbi:MAG: hypothetical protein IIA49_02470 [Bacteroidetes bacterium]|nr:hypothetical protein [Bacteroidota bacterium]
MKKAQIHFMETVFVLLTVIIIITFIGFMDDLIITKSQDTSTGLRQWQKPLLTLVAAIPLMVINAGQSVTTIPLLGRVDIGLLYPLLIIPIGIVGASNMVNLLAGVNGIETGMGVIYIGMLGLYAFVNSRFEAAAIALPHEVKGNAIHAFVILRDGYKRTDTFVEELRKHVGHEMGPIAKPEHIEIVDSLPKTRSGKIMRRVLKAKALGVDPGNISTLAD